MSNTIFKNKAEYESLKAQLKVMGVVWVNIRFEGSGDSGEVEYVEFKGDEKGSVEIGIDDATTAWTELTYGTQIPQQKQVSLEQAMMDIAYRVLDETQMDWYNNDGGQGNIKIGVRDELEISVAMGINITTTEDHEFRYDPVEDEEIFYDVVKEK